jgi:alanine-glyoxylate transaminase/serine-glyoxylate transaminase/serine-pyruvate transaminase
MMKGPAKGEMVDRYLKLMIPGPVQPADDVLEAMGSPVRPHYGPEWTRLYNETTEMLKPVFGTRGSIFLIVGSGTAGIDACLGSAVTTGEKILIGINGWFGQRLQMVAEGYGLDVVPVVGDWGQPLRAGDFAAALARHPDARLVACVHVETSTTVVNPIPEIGRVASKHGVPFMVDAVSSLGGLPICMDEWSIDLCASASQKCLGAPPGLAPVAVGPGGWEAIDRQPARHHGWYLNLRVWREYAAEWGDWHPFPITMATSNVMALRTSLQRLLDEGIPARLARYRSLALRLRGGLRAIGMPPYTSDEMLCPVVTAACPPPGVKPGEMVQYMAEVHGIKIAGGLGEPVKDKIFRIGHMAPTVSEADIDQVVDALASYPDGRNM